MRRRELLASTNNDEFVDFGLPSGLLWLKKNVGANTETDYGLYFQWGDTEGYTADQVGSSEGQKYFGWEDYKFNNDGSSPTDNNMTKYNSTDGKKTLETSDDATTVNLGSDYRTPTYEEFNELRANTTREVVTVNGVRATLYTGKNDSSKQIIFPHGGTCNEGTIRGSLVGHYQASTIATSTTLNNGSLVLNSNFDSTLYMLRKSGHNVRGVMDKPVPEQAKRNGSTASALSVLFTDKNGKGPNFIIENQNYWPNEEKYIPIGIVIVPGTHNRYGDNTCGVISLKPMDSNNPVNGGTSVKNLYWGATGTSISNNIFTSVSALTGNSTNIPYQANSNSTATTAQISATVWPYEGSETEPTSAANTNYSNTNGYVRATSGKSCCDFNGIRNTLAVYIKTQSSSQWTGNVSNTYLDSNITPAAACAGRYKTIGTRAFIDIYSGVTSTETNATEGSIYGNKINRNFWYLPSCGELCYLPRYKFEINKIVDSLNNKYGKGTAINFTTQDTYWSSSCCDSSNKAWRVSTVNGLIYGYNKSTAYSVRAFLRF